MRRTCLNMVHELAKTDERVVFIGSDLGAGTLSDMRESMPDRFFMEGIAEQHVMGMAAGMALEGFIPYVNTIATFITRRCFEQVAVDVCLHNLPVRMIGNGGGLVYAPLGPTHLATEDIAIMRALPNMTVVCPSDAEEMKRFMRQTVDYPGPIYIRLGKGGDPVINPDADGFEIGKAIPMRDGGKIGIISTGVMTGRVLQAADLVAGEGITCAVTHMPTVKPLDERAVFAMAKACDALMTVEEHTLKGGLGSAVIEALVDGFDGPMPKVKRIGLPDAFPKEYGSQDGQMETFGLQPPHIADAIRKLAEAL